MKFCTAASLWWGGKERSPSLVLSVAIVDDDIIRSTLPRARALHSLGNDKGGCFIEKGKNIVTVVAITYIGEALLL